MLTDAPKVKAKAFAKSNTDPSDMCIIRASDSKLQCWGYQYTFHENKGTCKTCERFFSPYTPPDLRWCPQQGGSWKNPGTEMCMKSQDPGVPVRAAAIGYTGGCAILSENNHAYCWGSNPSIFNRNFKTIGNRGGAKPEVVEEIPDEEFKDITVSGFSACAIKESDNKLSCWGMNHYGLVDKAIKEPVKMVRAALYTICALKQSDSKVFCWGGGEDEKDLVNKAPTTVPFDDLMMGYKAICGVRKDNKKMLCWGPKYMMDRNMKNVPGVEVVQ